MTRHSWARIAGSVVALAAIVVALTSIKAPPARANDDDTDSRIQIGFKIAPVPLNLEGKDPALVGLGSYLVNAVGDCNGCHTAGSPPLGLYPYVTGYNPYFSGQKEKIDPAVYLAGGTPFGTVGTPTGPNGYSGPVILPGTLPRIRMDGPKAATRLPSSSGSCGAAPISTTSIRPAPPRN